MRKSLAEDLALEAAVKETIKGGT